MYRNPFITCGLDGGEQTKQRHLILEALQGWAYAVALPAADWIIAGVIKSAHFDLETAGEHERLAAGLTRHGVTAAFTIMVAGETPESRGEYFWDGTELKFTRIVV